MTTAAAWEVRSADVCAGCQKQSEARFHSNICRRVPVLAIHSGLQLLEGACEAPAACGQHSMLSG